MFVLLKKKKKERIMFEKDTNGIYAKILKEKLNEKNYFQSTYALS